MRINPRHQAARPKASAIAAGAGLTTASTVWVLVIAFHRFKGLNAEIVKCDSKDNANRFISFSFHFFLSSTNRPHITYRSYSNISFMYSFTCRFCFDSNNISIITMPIRNTPCSHCNTSIRQLSNPTLLTILDYHNIKVQI